MKLVFATHNQHKLKEVASLITSNIHLLSLADINFTDDIAETASTIEGNSLLKAEYIYKTTGYNCFADDSGLEIEQLNGAPGVHSARYAGEQKNDADNCQKVLKELWGKANRKARFKTVVTLILNGQTTYFEGTIEGNIAETPAGNNGFGYDPLFIPNGYSLTFAQMQAQEKNKISHRAIAVGKLVNFLNQL